MKVVIAGGTSGIGLATAQAFRSAGAEVIVTGRDTAKIAVLPAGIRGIVVADLSDFFAEVGPFDHLVLALGGSKGIGMFRELDLDVLQEGFEEKFFPHLRYLQAALPYVTGSVTFISAVSGHTHFPGVSGLAAINGALEVITPILAKELQPLRVNAVSPGVIDTPWWDFVPARAEALAGYAQATPVGRVGQAGDVASVVAMVAQHTFVTGQVVTVDGGLGL
jgi:NAD(P)-dependent dehydrogenase (short-subunit alcohol dehydrogenase family)